MRIGAGPLATERLLLRDLDSMLKELGTEVLRRPILIVVPSTSLRLHLLAAITGKKRAALAGVTCRTLYGLAREIDDRLLGSRPQREELVDLLARRMARLQPALERGLGHLADGYGAAAGTVRDFLDAGLEPVHVEALEEALREEGPEAGSPAEIERAVALVRAAADTLEALEASGGDCVSTLYRRAAESVRLEPERAVPVSALLIYGFEDATGVATDLLHALLDRLGGALYLDRPPDPSAPDRPDPGAAFTRRFAERIESVASPDPQVEPRAEAPAVEMVRAVGGEAETREVARRIRRLLDAGTDAEAIGVVARRLEPYRADLRIQFDRLGIPFSAVGAAGPPRPAGRRLAALLELLERGDGTPVERWLDALASPPGGAPLHDLRLALSSLGAARLGEVPKLRFRDFLEEGDYRLPARLGLFGEEADQGSEKGESERREVRAARRRISGAALEAAVEAAAALCQRLRRVGRARTLGEQTALLRGILSEDLEWRSDAEERGAVEGILGALEAAPGTGFELDREELRILLSPGLQRAGLDPLGGEGGGVQVLEVMEARSRTFEHLFLIGLNRGVFPRTVREDPLLPDGLRGILARRGFGLLPDLPLKLGGFDEERYLFAQLLAASPALTLSWQVVDDENVEQSPSPLVERLRWAADDPSTVEPVATARHLYSLSGADAETELRPAFESAVLAGLAGDRERLGELLGLAFEEADRRDALEEEQAAPSGDTRRSALAAARIRILDEVDPRFGPARHRLRLGPYYGFVGPPGAEDPRLARRVFVTTLERLAGCPWQVFLERVLRLEPTPDPLEVLPGIEPLLVGGLVHRVLERLIRKRLGDPPQSLTEARGSAPRVVPWPEPGELERYLEQEASRLVREEGIGFDGFARVLGEVVRPYLEIARRLDWGEAEGGPAVLAAELEGEVAIPGRHSLFFKADRVDRRDGGLVLTDYKTGRHFLKGGATPATLRRTLLAAVRSGERLQAAAYALAGGDPRDRGRYLFLRPERDENDPERAVPVGADDAELAKAFQRAAGATLAAWDRGAFFPRLVEPEQDREPARCRWCAVAEACLRGDSGARRRLREWAAAAVAEEGARAEEPEPERALIGVWRLPARSAAAGGEP